MLPIVHNQRYQEFKQALEQLHVTASDAHLDASRLRQSFLLAQQFFQQQILTLDAGDLQPTLEPKVRSYQTEMSKQLRLLGMDVIFLQAARQPGTVQERQLMLRDRIVSLKRYCDAILQLN